MSFARTGYSRSTRLSRLTEAASIEPAKLRSLDAVHLATALSIRDEIGVFITYDNRLVQAAAGQGLVVTQPS